MNIVRNTFSNIFLSISKGLAGLLIIPLFIRLIGKQDYGIIVLIMGIMGYAELFDVGLRPALVRQLSAEKLDDQEANGIFNSAIVGSFLYFAAAFLLIAPLVWFFGQSLGIPAPELHSLWFYLFLFFYLFLQILSPIFSAVLISKNRFDLVNFRAGVFTIFGLFFTIFLVWITGLSYEAWMLSSLISKMLELITIFLLCRKYHPALHVRIRNYSGEKLRSLLSFGWKMLVSKWNKKIKFDSDPIILSYFLGPASLALYRPGAALVQSIRPIVSAMSGQLFVSASHAHRDQDKNRLRLILFSGSKITVLVFLPVFFVLFFSGEWLISLWLGKSFSVSEMNQIYQVMLGWLVIDLFFYLEGSSYSVLFGMNKLDFMIKADFLISIANIVCSVLLLKFSDLGIISVLIPGLLLELFARVGFFFHTAKQIGISILSCLKDYLLPVFFVFGLVFIPLWFLQASHISFLSGLIILAFLTGLFYPFLAWRIGLSAEERTLLSQKLQHYLPFLKRNVS
jgi:O-antigen/teichoic acid export membrane protein